MVTNVLTVLSHLYQNAFIFQSVLGNAIYKVIFFFAYKQHFLVDISNDTLSLFQAIL